MKIKRIFASLFITIMILGALTACGDTTGDLNPNSAKQEADDRNAVISAVIEDQFKNYDMTIGDWKWEYSNGNHDGIAISGYIGNSTKVKIPDTMFFKSVLYISDTTFQFNRSVTDIYIPDSVTGIGVFLGCTSLKSVRLSENIHDIGPMAFQDCVSLETLSVPDKVTTIGFNAFLNCSGLKKVILPDNLLFLSREAFAGCDNVVVTYRGTDYKFEKLASLYEALYRNAHTAVLNGANPKDEYHHFFSPEEFRFWESQGFTNEDSEYVYYDSLYQQPPNYNEPYEGGYGIIYEPCYKDPDYKPATNNSSSQNKLTGAWGANLDNNVYIQWVFTDDDLTEYAYENGVLVNTANVTYSHSGNKITIFFTDNTVECTITDNTILVNTTTGILTFTPDSSSPSTPNNNSVNTTSADYLKARVTIDSDYLNLRSETSTSAEIVNKIPNGSTIDIIDGPYSDEDYLWFYVSYNGICGYVVSDFLQIN